MGRKSFALCEQSACDAVRDVRTLPHQPHTGAQWMEQFNVRDHRRHLRQRPVFVVLTTGAGANPVAVLNTYAAAAEVAACHAFEAGVADLA